MKEYLSKFVELFPGDHPSQFFSRQIIYEVLCKYIANLTAKTSVPQEELLSLVPLIGPLHIDLNADEDLVLNYHPFIKSLYYYLSYYFQTEFWQQSQSLGGYNLSLKLFMGD